jgi:hypothetical protein
MPVINHKDSNVQGREPIPPSPYTARNLHLSLCRSAPRPDRARPLSAMREEQAMATLRPFGLLTGTDPFRELGPGLG